MILVTGGTGFVGSRLVAALSARGQPARVLTRTQGGQGDPGAGRQVAIGDLLKPATLAAALDGVTTVVHLAASVPRPGQSEDTFRANMEATRNLARAVRGSSVQRFVHGSSAGVYGDGTLETPHSENAPTNARTGYERSKRDAEEALTSELAGSRVRWVILRPAGIHGAGRPATLAFYRTVQRRKLWVHGPARVIVHPTHVDDVVHAILLALDRNDLEGETFNVGGERPMEYSGLIETIGRILGRRVVQVTPVPRAVRAGARALQGAAAFLGRPPSERVARLATPLINRAVDTSKARQLLGFEPVPLEESIRKAVDSFRRKGLL